MKLSPLVASVKVHLLQILNKFQLG